MGWKVGREPGRYKGRRVKYSDVEISWLRDNCTLPIGEYHQAFCSAFNRQDVTAVGLQGMRKREGWKTGRTGQFDKGAVPWAKGKKLPFNANSAATQFKKGLTPHNRRGPGHESVDEDGYIWIVTDQRNPWTGASTWRVHKHRWLWEQTYGPVPEGMVLKCLGDKANTDPSNWEPVPIGLLPRLNGKSNRGYDRAPAELKPTIMAVAKLEHAAAARRKSKSERTPT
ncbi:MAG: HNH endonuclease [Mesorhizobium sp.]|nr:MAG: HNH endonuclease [Mesorhizobium sp.]